MHFNYYKIFSGKSNSGFEKNEFFLLKLLNKIPGRRERMGTVFVSNKKNMMQALRFIRKNCDLRNGQFPQNRIPPGFSFFRLDKTEKQANF